MEFNKSAVKRAFDRAESTYENVATVQKQCANQLTETLRNNYPNFIPDSILDIGTGTGFIPQLLLSQFPDSNYTLNDISTSMLNNTRKKLQNLANFHFISGDMEVIDFSDYDLIISNLAFQWANDLPKCLNKFYNKSKVFAFSCLLAGTFKEWTEKLQKDSSPLTINNYLSETEINTVLLNLNPKHYYFQVKEFVLVFETIVAFLKYLKCLGAHASIQTPSTSDLRNVLKNHHQEFRITYRIFFGILER